MVFLISKLTKVNIIMLSLASDDVYFETTPCGLLLSPWLTKKITKNELSKASNIFFVVLEWTKTRIHIEALSEGKDK